MRTFILRGSKGGAGRTASSVVLATGLAGIGRRPLHVQLTLSGISPVIAQARGIPFSTAWLPEEVATWQAIQRTVETHPDCDTVVIDMLKRTPREVVHNGPEAVVLFPMRHAAVEIEVAVRDYRDLQIYLQRDNTLDPKPSARPASGWLLPVSWPSNLSESEIAAGIARFDESQRLGSPSPSVLTPGIPTIPRDDLDDLINGESFQCSPSISAAAEALARAATKLSG